MKTFSNVAVSISSPNWNGDKPDGYHASIHWENEDGNGCHVWVKLPELLLTSGGWRSGRGPTLYVNPPKGLKRGYIGYFQTRRLDATNKANGRYVENVIAFVREHRLHLDAIEAHENKEREEAEARERKRIRWQDARKLVEDHKAEDIATAALMLAEQYREGRNKLARALARWQRFARDNGWKDSDYHDADGTGWITETDSALASIPADVLNG